MAHAQSCRPVQAFCYRILVTKQSTFYQDISQTCSPLVSVQTSSLGRTGPEAPFLDVYFNAYLVGSLVDAKQKLEAPTNALMPTVIPYADGIVENAVPSEHKL
ncbi:uncharacterized protein F5147DRAFT_379775 [Suillus discolor]|uniref:Uncharacterized protein n=1 Tax=Suillus discolor TaxID=1912936 RepID=A0A9P7JY39_9AGAM|nr:uncharacterized protein F5147DRAFT_379775 [Suillus discolor]KAG2115736.1 hypothetical protein F5147DRAFT_379775 [Suillus discolor]